MNKNRAKIFIYLLIIGLLIGSGFLVRQYLIRNNRNHLFKNISPVSEKLSLPIKTSSSSPTFPSRFEELTIPYLKQRDYSSNMDELEEYSRNSEYISYLTSYNSEGLNINGLLTKPLGEQPEGGWPAIVFIHGYIPPNQYQTTERYVSYVDYLARNGFVVFKIDLRGHGESEGMPSGAYYSGDYIVDTLKAYSALQGLDFVNENKIGLWGHSMAGNIIVRSITVNTNIPAAVIWSGAVFTYNDFIEYGIDDDSYQPPDSESERRQRRQSLFDTYGRYDPDSDFWSQVTPLNYFEDVNTNLQLHHAIDDNVTSIDYSRNLQSILNDLGKNVELYEYDTGGHNINDPSFKEAMQRTVDFFNNNLF